MQKLLIRLLPASFAFMKFTEMQQKKVKDFLEQKKTISSYHLGHCYFQLSLEQGQFPNGVKALLH